MMDLTDRQLNTVLAALRNWQGDLSCFMRGQSDALSLDLLDVARDGGVIMLSVDEIDELCEELNFPC